MPATLADAIGARAWRRSDAGESGGQVFHLTGDACDLFLKYGTGPVADAIVDEAVRLRWLAGRVAAPAVVQVIAADDAAWLLTRALPGLTGDEWLERDPASIKWLVPAFASFLRALHALPVDDCPFDAGAAVRLAQARRNVAGGLVDEEDFDEDHAGWRAADMLGEVERRADFTAELVVTHGDFSLGNVLFDADRRATGCIDVGRLGVADRYQDIAILWQNLAEHGAAVQAHFLSAIGIEAVDERRLRFHRCLDELF